MTDIKPSDMDKIMFSISTSKKQYTLESSGMSSIIKNFDFVKDEKTRNLFTAICNGQADKVIEAIDNGADVNADLDSEKDINKLIRNHFCLSTMRFAVLCDRDNINIMKILFDKGYSRDIDELFYYEPSNLSTALGVSAYCGYLEKLKLLISHGANVNIKMGNNRPLHIAIKGGFIEKSNKTPDQIVDCLLNSGANPKYKNTGGYKRTLIGDGKSSIELCLAYLNVSKQNNNRNKYSKMYKIYEVFKKYGYIK